MDGMMVSSPSDIDHALKQQQESLLWAALTLRLTQEAQVILTLDPEFSEHAFRSLLVISRKIQQDVDLKYLLPRCCPLSHKSRSAD